MPDETTSKTDKQAEKSTGAQRGTSGEAKAEGLSPVGKETAQVQKGEKVAEAPKPDDEGKLPALSGRELDIARNTGVRTGGSTAAAADEYAALGVNPRLDNRLGRQRPQAAGFAPKPQQFPGPEVGHFEEHKEAMGAEFDELFGRATDDPRGMHAPGPHGRGDDDEFAQRIASNPEG